MASAAAKTKALDREDREELARLAWTAFSVAVKLAWYSALAVGAAAVAGFAARVFLNVAGLASGGLIDTR